MSFGKMGGIYCAKSYADILFFMAMGMSVFDQDRSKFLLNEYRFKPILFDALNEELFKLSCGDYVRYCCEHYKTVNLQFDGSKQESNTCIIKAIQRKRNKRKQKKNKNKTHS